MVKADAKHDYYADLELPCTADQESIKRKFRDLAKQYHPDRNPGHEVDAVPKFQAVQTAHEILSDPIQKSKYDADRARLNKTNTAPADTQPFKKPPPPSRASSSYTNDTFSQSPNTSAPGFRGDPSATRSFQPSGDRTRRPNSTATGTAEKFAQFARAAGSQQWDRSRFDAAAAADGLRGMNAMRGSTQNGSQTRRAPTAPRHGSDAQPYSAGPGPSPGFPGLGRTASGRRGFNPAAGGGDEPPSSAGSAYLHTHRADRPPSEGPFGSSSQKHPKPRGAVSPLRQSRSAHFSDVVYAVRPGLQRDPSRYAQQGGERTFLNTGNISRSTSVRNSPVEPRWESDANNNAPQQQSEDRAGRPRHRSLSPPRAGRSKFEFANSSTSSEDESTPPVPRPKATPRAFHPQTGPSTRTFSDDDPALTGQFPKTNYKRSVDESQYNYPPPTSKGPATKPFSGASYSEDAENSSGETATGNASPEQSASTFDPSRWHDAFGKSEENIFRPNESTTNDKRSPTRNSRAPRPTMRSQQNSHEERFESAKARDEPTLEGFKYVSPDEKLSKASVFQPGKLSSDWNSYFSPHAPGRRASDVGVSTSRRGSATAENDISNAQDAGVNHDKMDVDEPQPADPLASSPTASDSSYKVTVEEESPPRSTRSHRRSSTAQSVNGGVHIGSLDNMDDLTKQAPFAPSEAGLKGMSDLHTGLPFPSQASREPPLQRTNSHIFRHLALPQPPEPPHEPKELTQSSWKAYADAMTEYMQRWTKFNAQMLAHFQARQEQTMHCMYRNWISAQGDGASADSFEHNFGSGHPGERAGYQTYVAWLEDDNRCRAWWDVACEEHTKCMKALGDVRTKVKAMAHC